jgi:hypothetical protein
MKQKSLSRLQGFFREAIVDLLVNTFTANQYPNFSDMNAYLKKKYYNTNTYLYSQTARSIRNDIP